MKLVFTSTDYTKVKVIESTLSANNIKPITKGEYLDVLNAIIPRQSNLIELYVSDDDYPKALEIIDHGIQMTDSIEEEEVFPIHKLNRYQELTNLNAKKDKTAIYALLSGILLISNIYFIILFVLEMDKFIKFKNSMSSDMYEYEFDEANYCSSRINKEDGSIRYIACFDKETDVTINEKYYDMNGKLTSESFNPYKTEFITIQISYDTHGIKTEEYIDNDLDGEFDEHIVYDQKGLKEIRYVDKNKDHRFEKSEIVESTSK